MPIRTLWPVCPNLVASANDYDTAEYCAIFSIAAHRIESVRTTIVGLITPHFLRIIDLATQAEKGVAVDWHVRNEVSNTVASLADQYNARELLSAYVNGLKTAAEDAGPGRKSYAALLENAASLAAREIDRLE